jgi:hypothetical protein
MLLRRDGGQGEPEINCLMPILTEELHQTLASKPSNTSAGPPPNVDRRHPHAPAWFPPRGRPTKLTSSDCYHRAGGGP